MKKINPKVAGIVMLLLSTLLAGSFVVQEGMGDPTLAPDPPEDTGN